MVSIIRFISRTLLNFMSLVPTNSHSSTTRSTRSQEARATVSCVIKPSKLGGGATEETTEKVEENGAKIVSNNDERYLRHFVYYPR